MESVNVLVTTNIGEEFLQQISSVSPRIKVTDAADLRRDEQNEDSAATEKLNVLLADTEVLFGLTFPQNYIARAPGLKWVQTMTAGMNRFLDADMMSSPVVLTGVSGIHATPIGEFVLCLMLMFVKQMPRLYQLKQEKQWDRFSPGKLRPKTVGIIGLGAIGREVARLSKAFGMRVLATRRSAKQVGRGRYIDIIYPLDQLQQLLSESDFVVIALPLTHETTGLIGEKELQAMKSTAYLINIGRGPIVDEEALIRALDERWIAGAGLDVVTTEPLPQDSRLWELPNVILSPHISGVMEDYMEIATGFFLENLRRYLDGRKLINVIDKQKGY